jgi:hypothetical protein
LHGAYDWGVRSFISLLKRDRHSDRRRNRRNSQFAPDRLFLLIAGVYSAA